MNKLTQILTKMLGLFLITLMGILVLNVTWQVVTRFILRNPSAFTEELAGFLLIWIGLLGASYALHTKAHLGIDIFTIKLTGFKKQMIEVAIYTIIILFAFFVMIIGGFRLVQLTLKLNQISPTLGIKMGYVYLVIPLSGLFFIYYSIVLTMESFQQKPTQPAEHEISKID
ncbi:TRAP transporter small permease [bacterium]|nr:TRAP transporter small permease [bacterium]